MVGPPQVAILSIKWVDLNYNSYLFCLVFSYLRYCLGPSSGLWYSCPCYACLACSSLLRCSIYSWIPVDYQGVRLDTSSYFFAPHLVTSFHFLLLPGTSCHFMAHLVTPWNLARRVLLLLSQIFQKSLFNKDFPLKKNEKEYSILLSDPKID